MQGCGVGKGEMPRPHCPSTRTADREADSGVTRVGKLNLLLNGCRTRERPSSTSPGQHSRADPVDRDTGYPAPALFCHMGEWLRKSCPAPSPAPCHLWPVRERVLSLITCSTQKEPCISPGWYARADPVHSGKSALRPFPSLSTAPCHE